MVGDRGHELASDCGVTASNLDEACNFIDQWVRVYIEGVANLHSLSYEETSAVIFDTYNTL